MEQFVFVTVPVCNNTTSKIKSVTKQELAKFETNQNPTHQTHSLKEEINKKLFAKADFLVGKIFSCPCIKLSNSQTLKLDDVQTGVLLSDFAQQQLRKNSDVFDIQFTLPDADGKSPTLVPDQNAKTKERGSWVPFKI